MPVDPYDPLRGYSQTLGYEISDINQLRKLPGGDRFDRQIQGAFYVVLQQPAANATPPTPWQAVRLTSDRPTDLDSTQIALRGRYDRGQITYGLERFYMPEDQRNQINEDFTDAGGRTVTQVKVDDRGNAVLVNLWLGDRALQF
ncbi:MAG: GDYXXLXY domain-containing protein [Leptolyngbyaceae cyanobacterium SM1_3_5]|nr:GDYXXLXY domain-containing protein [Leptolyngbyaceae cyanobacterium SM1_3_5]